MSDTEEWVNFRQRGTTITGDPLEMLARLCQHIPSPGLHLTRLYGAYTNRTRGARAQRMAGERPTCGHREADTPVPSQRERRRQWARPIAKVFEVDPLRCAACGGTMRVIAFILDPTVIRKILRHRPRPAARPRATDRLRRLRSLPHTLAAPRRG